jgi:Zn-dependent peptidase ImmA (M78 family)
VSLLRRGFKTWCENAARGFRRELGLSHLDPIDPRSLAAFFDVKVWTPHDIPGLDKKTLSQLLQKDIYGWSAVTIREAGRSLIIVNSAQPVERQNNSIAHELSHIALNHTPAQAFFSADGAMVLNHYNPTHEEEATYLSGAVLVPREALLHIIGKGFTHEKAASFFRVTTDLLKMRLNLTGINRQLAYRSRRAKF